MEILVKMDEKNQPRPASAIRGLALTAALLAAVEQPLAAYTDPGSGALLWQILVAGFVGFMFYLYKLTSLFRKKRRSKDRPN